MANEDVSIFSEDEGKKKPAKEHNHLKPLLTVFIGLIIITGAVFGVWYWQQGEMKKQREESDRQIQALQKQVNDLKKEQANTTSSEKKKSVRDVDFLKIVTVGEGSMLTNTEYADYNNDGQEEALITVTVDGTGGYKEYYVYGYRDDVLTKYLSANITDLKDAYGEGYNGHDKMEFTSGKLVLSHPVYKPDDPNCCPTGGTKYTYFKWNGSKFIIDRQETK